MQPSPSTADTLKQRAILLISTLLIMSGSMNAEVCGGTVMDPSGEFIKGAAVSLSGSSKMKALTDGKGTFSLACMTHGKSRLHVYATGFEPKDVVAEEHTPLVIRLKIQLLKQEVQVGGDDGAALDEDHGSGTHTLSSKDIANMANDPDDFKRQLQVLAAASGGAPGQAVMTVDGFQNTGGLPPKSSIASIRVSPDLYSAEYSKPPYEGGRVEIFTKPGDAPRGAVFFNESGSALNANDPLTQGSTPASKQDYGFELGGPIKKQKSDYFIALEKRDTNEFNIVNAFTANSVGAAVAFRQNVPAPQRFLNGTARSDWQLGTSNTLAASYTINDSIAANQGAGGLVLAEAGYRTKVSEQNLRLTDSGVLSPNLLSIAHLGFTWKSTQDTPVSGGTGFMVAGAFIGGGSTTGALLDRERDFEADEELSWTHGQHSLKFGVTSLGILAANRNPNTFNGQYLFAGESADLTGLQQYQRALLGIPGGTPTSYSINRGSAAYDYSQWLVALYAQDQWKLTSQLSVSLGLRYVVQVSPGISGSAAPRLGIAWSPDKKQKWVLRAHAGFFYSPVDPSVLAEQARLNGSTQQQLQIYSPDFASPLSSTGSSVSVATTRQPGSGVGQSTSFQAQAGVERQLPQHWHIQANISLADGWGLLRSRNINAPLVNAGGLNPLLGARPYLPGENILEFEPTGRMKGTVSFIGIDQHSYKHFGVFAGYLMMNLRTDADDPMLLPQSSYSNLGEMARPSWEPQHQVFGAGTIALPYKIAMTTQLSLSSGTPYNLVTGFDNNGDGSFNDRPSIATTTGPGVYQTPFGLLSTLGVNGTLARNFGTMPVTVHLDSGLSRTFGLPWRALAADTRQSITLNARVANLLNHTNVASVGNVVGSPSLSQALTAEPARRVEFGLRFTF